MLKLTCDLITHQQFSAAKIEVKSINTLYQSVLKADRIGYTKNLNSANAGQQILLGDYLTGIAPKIERAELVGIADNAVDLAIFCLVVSLILLERKSASVTQRNIAAALDRVEKLNSELQITLIAKEDIFKTTVHDLKNPLSSMVGMADLLGEDLAEVVFAKRMCDMIKKSGYETLALVDSALKTEIDRTVTVEKIDLNQVVQETCQLLEPLLDKKQQRFKIISTASEFKIGCANNIAHSIFFNVIGNASKFSPEGTTIIVNVCHDQDSFIVEVKDQGPGFQADDFAKLFHKGVSLSAKPTGSEVSTGYGLFSVKQQMTKLEGSVQIANNQDKGATVSLLFKEGLAA